MEFSEDKNPKRKYCIPFGELLDRLLEEEDLAYFSGEDGGEIEADSEG